MVLNKKKTEASASVFLWERPRAGLVPLGEGHLFETHQLGLVLELVAQPQQREQRDAQIGGDDAVPVDMAATESLIPLAQGDDQTEGERQERTKREEHGDVGQILQSAALDRKSTRLNS